MSWTPRHIPFYLTPAAPASGVLTVVLSADDAAGSTWAGLTTPNSRWGVGSILWAGAPVETTYSGDRPGDLGARSTTSRRRNAPLRIDLRLYPDGHDEAAQLVGELELVVSRMQRMGGQVTIRRAGQTHRQHFQVLGGDGVQISTWDAASEIDGRCAPSLSFVCGPHVLGDPMEVGGRFTTVEDVAAAFSFTAGTSGDITVGDGEVAPVGTAASAAVHAGYTYGDARVSVTVVPGATIATALYAGVIGKWVDAANSLLAYVDDTGAASRLVLASTVAGVFTAHAAVNLPARMSAGTPVTVTLEQTGNTLAATAGGVTATHTLTGAGVTALGHGVEGRAGWSLNPGHADARLRDFRIEPFSLTDPGQVIDHRFSGTVPGDAPALTEVEVTAGGSPSASVTFGLLSLDAAPQAGNAVTFGAFEEAASGAVGAPWSTAAVSGLTVAATSLAYVASGSGRFGDRCAEAVLPASTWAGVVCAVRPPGGFRAGRTYEGRAWLRAPSGSTTSVRVALGVSSTVGVGVGAASALTPVWRRYDVSWTPTVDAAVAWLVVANAAAGATTVRIDGAQVWETEPVIASQQDGAGGAPPVGLLLPSTAHTLTGFAATAVSAGWPYASDRVLRSTAVTSSARWRVDPMLVDPEDHSDTVDMEVWAYITVPAGLTSPVAVVSVVGGVSGVASYSREYGSAGCGLTAIGTVWRLGTVSLPRVPDGRVDLRVQVSGSGGSGTTDIGWVMLVRPSARAAWPTGKSAAGYPEFIPDPGGASSTVKRVHQDGRGVVRTAGDAGFSAGSGASRPLVIPPGEFMLHAVMCHGIPSGSSAAASCDIERVRVSPTPRWHYLRH